MSTRVFQGWSVGLAALIAACAPAGSEGPSRPNLLILSVDTLRADHLGVYGYERPTSPEIDSLARESIVFDAAISASAWTLPSMASLMTSVPVSVHGCSTASTSLHPDSETLAERLHAAGYDTAAVVSHTFLGMRYGFQQGFVWFDDELVRDLSLSHKAVTSEVVSDKGLAYLTEKAQTPEYGPWFLWLHYFDPHSALVVHEGISERFGVEEQLDLYDGEIAYTDFHIGRVLDSLEELGLADNTIVVLVADHGESFEPTRDPPIEGKAPDGRHGSHVYSEVIRVPLLMRIPGADPRRVGTTVSVVDVMPTLLEVMGQKRGISLRGRSLVPLVEGDPFDDVPVLCELKPFNDRECDAFVDGQWKLIDDRMRDRVLLFHLASDPGESRDVYAEQPERGAAMLRALNARRAEQATWGVMRQDAVDLSPSNETLLQKLGYAGN